MIVVTIIILLIGAKVSYDLIRLLAERKKND